MAKIFTGGAGQGGFASGEGNTTSDTLRVVSASDDSVAKLVSEPKKATLVKITKFITDADPSISAEPLVDTETFARSLDLQAKRIDGDNVGNVFIGLSDLQQGSAELFELAPGNTVNLEMPLGIKLDLSDIYIDVDNDNDGVVGWYLPS